MKRQIVRIILCMILLATSLCALPVEAKQKKIVNVTKQKYTYSEMKKDIEQLSKQYGEYCTYDVIGKTAKGRNIYDVIIGNPNASKSILVVSTLHAREYVCSVLSMQVIEYYLKHYEDTVDGVKPSEVFDKIQLHVVVMANPDGVTIAQGRNTKWKANGRGVDLNRNFPYRFVVRGKRGAEEYTGKKPASEKETKAIIRLTKKLKKNTKLCAQINYHAMGQIVFGGYNGRDKKMKREITKMYQIARKTTGYSDSSGYHNFSNGNLREYIMYSLKIPSITIEVGATTCPNAYWEYDSIYKKNRFVLLRIANLY